MEMIYPLYGGQEPSGSVSTRVAENRRVAATDYGRAIVVPSRPIPSRPSSLREVS